MGQYGAVVGQYPGKHSKDTQSWLPLCLHAWDTASVMARLVDSWLSEQVRETIGRQTDWQELRGLAVFLGLVHDIGKLTPVFAARITEGHPKLVEKLSVLGLRISPWTAFDSPGKTPHAKAGEALFLHIAKGGHREIASIIGAHHGKPQEEDLKDYVNTYPQHFYGVGESKKTEQGQMWDGIQREWLFFCLREAGYASVEDLPAIELPAQVLLTGLLIMADWIASNTEYFPLLDLDEDGGGQDLEERFQRGWDAAHLPLPWYSVFMVRL